MGSKSTICPVIGDGATYLLGVGGVGDGADVAVAVHHAVAAGDLVTLSLLLAVLVVGELVILHVERELVGRTGL